MSSGVGGEGAWLPRRETQALRAGNTQNPLQDFGVQEISSGTRCAGEHEGECSHIVEYVTRFLNE